MIKYDYEITVNGNQAKLNKDIYLFRGNKNVHYYFAVKNASFNFKGSTDLIEKTNAINAAVTVIKPNNVEVASAIAKVENGKIHLKVTEDLIDEEVEVGDFDLVFDLFDDTDGAVTIPKVIGQFHVLERPCTTPISELVATNTTNEVDQALTDYAIVTYAEPVASTNADGTFAKKTWVAKEKITTAELNRMEEGISDVSSQCKDIAKQTITTDERTKLNSLENYDDTTVKTNIQNVQQQVNNLVLGAVGDENNPEVVQSRGQYSLLNERLDNDFVNLWNIKTISWKDGFYLNPNGATVPLTGFSVSDFILTEDYEIIKLRNYSNNDQLSSVVFYDFEGNIISKKVINDGKNVIDIEIPFGCYQLKLCKNNSSNPTLYFKSVINNKMVEIGNMDKMHLGYIDTDGTVKGELDDFVYTDYMKVVNGIEIKNIKENKDYPNIVFYDEDLNFVSSINSISYYLFNDYPSNAKYFIVATRKVNKLSIRVPINYFSETREIKSPTINVPKFIDVIKNKENNIYLDNIGMSNNSTYIADFEHKIVDNAIQFTPTTSVNLVLQEREDNYKLINEKTTVLRAVSNSFINDTSKNIIIIGDSLIDNSHVAKETYNLLTTAGVKFNQLGTRGVEGGKHEGRSGWTWSDYYKAQYNGVVNAFYDNGNLNFKKYCETNGYTGIDYCIIALGTNDVGHGGTHNVFLQKKNTDTIISRAKGFIDCLVRDYPNCKIAIGLPAIGADTNMGNSNLFRYKMKRLIQAYINTFDNGTYKANVTTVAHGLFINRREGYPYTNIPISNRFSDINTRCYSDFIHSNPNGYYCYADAFYAKIMSWLQGNL